MASFKFIVSAFNRLTEVQIAGPIPQPLLFAVAGPIPQPLLFAVDAAASTEDVLAALARLQQLGVARWTVNETVVLRSRAREIAMVAAARLRQARAGPDEKHAREARISGHAVSEVEYGSFELGKSIS